MTDIFDVAKRSEIMSRIRGKNTKSEILVAKYLRANRIYFQKHYRSREGIVMDFALPRRKKVLFIDGDFWHGRTIEKIVEKRGEDDFWTRKIRRNIERDKDQRLLLASNGWSIMTVWESNLARKKTRTGVLVDIEEFLREDRAKL
jgi:DNA mismatch endonuclease (patch repair protein)